MGRRKKKERIEKREREETRRERCFLVVAAPFVGTWRTTYANETITLPLSIAPSNNFTVEWGDGIVDYNLTVLPIVHVYTNARTARTT